MINGYLIFSFIVTYYFKSYENINSFKFINQYCVKLIFNRL